jgi:hypothetical protein
MPNKAPFGVQSNMCSTIIELFNINTSVTNHTDGLESRAYLSCIPTMSRAVSRRSGQQAVVTKSPDPAPLPMFCDACDGLLTFIESTLGGVAPPERWDRYTCKRCRAGFEYRHRTRKLRRIA